jgi:hypothetical protein
VDFSLKFFLFLFHDGGEKCTPKNRKKCLKKVLWIRNYLVRIRILLSRSFQIRIDGFYAKTRTSLENDKLSVFITGPQQVF